MSRARDLPFYHEGVAFSCKEHCAACCKASGHVLVLPDDISAMAEILGVTGEWFRDTYVREKSGELHLTERADGACAMLGEDDRCRVYAARPLQCRTYPFWPEVLANEFTWILEKRVCPGIGEGRRYSREEIEAVLQGKATAAGFGDTNEDLEAE